VVLRTDGHVARRGDANMFTFATFFLFAKVPKRRGKYIGYIYICVCVCVCITRTRRRGRG
jgi:hypothetical protein